MQRPKPPQTSLSLCPPTPPATPCYNQIQAYYHRYLETLNGLGFEFAEGGFLKHFLELKPGMRREREAKVGRRLTLAARRSPPPP